MRSVIWHALLLVACGSSPGSLPRLPEPAPPTAPSSDAALAAEAPKAETSQTSTAPPPAPPSGVDWGTPHPAFLIAADAGRRWVALCQARNDTNDDGEITVAVGDQGQVEGDDLASYLITTPGAGEGIDAFAGSDPTGRFVAFVANGRLWLLDTRTGERRDLSESGASIADDRTSYGSHRAAAFDLEGKRLLYFRPRQDKEDIVVLDLTDGTEIVLDPGDGLVWRAGFDASSQRVIAQVVTEDTNKNGRLDWPVPKADVPVARCLATPPRFAVWDRPGDRAHPRVLPLPEGPPQDSPELVVRLAEASVERDPDGSLHFRLRSGQRQLLAKKQCEGRLVHADPARTLVISTCRDKKTRRHGLWLRGVGYAKDLELSMVTAGPDFWLEGSPALVPLHAGRDTALVDMASRKRILLAEGDRVVSTHEDRALFVRGNDLMVRGSNLAETPLGVEMGPYGKTLQGGPFIAAMPWVVDLRAVRVVGRFDRTPWSLSRDGFGLVPSEPAANGRSAQGPFKWIAPEPRDTPTNAE